MESQDYDKITITDIVKKAGVGRASFYRHYYTKEDVISDSFKDQLKEFQNKWSKDEDELFQLMQYFYNHKKLLDVLFKSDLEDLLLKLIVSMFEYDESDENIIAYMKTSWSYFLFGLMSEWYRRGMQEAPAELSSQVRAFFTMMRQMDDEEWKNFINS